VLLSFQETSLKTPRVAKPSLKSDRSPALVTEAPGAWRTLAEDWGVA
jgi:hypothetical protein